MNQFIFETRQKTVLGVMMLIGVISLVVTYMGDDHSHTRFWSNVLHNSVFFTGVALMALFLIAAKITAWSGSVSYTHLDVYKRQVPTGTMAEWRTRVPQRGVAARPG